MDDRLHQRNAGVTGQRSKARPNDGLAENLPVLLGQIPAGAQPAARCDNDGCNASDHVLPVEDDVASWLSVSRPRRKPAYRASRPLSIRVRIFCTAALAHSGKLAKLYAAGIRRLIRVQRG
jgi:hypothetical protein